jgi:hypothetical protein
MATNNDLVIKFANKEALRHFAVWLCESGEQSYWDWMEYREGEEGGDITAVTFNYHGAENNKEFMSDNTIRTKIGRLGRR